MSQRALDQTVKFTHQQAVFGTHLLDAALGSFELSVGCFQRALSFEALLQDHEQRLFGRVHFGLEFLALLHGSFEQAGGSLECINCGTRLSEPVVRRLAGDARLCCERRRDEIRHLNHNLVSGPLLDKRFFRSLRPSTSANMT